MRKALKVLQQNRLVEITGTGATSRPGGKPPVLYAITWESIDEYWGKGVMTVKPTFTPVRSDWDKPVN